MKSVKLTRIISYFKSFFMHFHFTRYVKNTFPAAVNISSASGQRLPVCRSQCRIKYHDAVAVISDNQHRIRASCQENTGLPQLT